MPQEKDLLFHTNVDSPIQQKREDILYKTNGGDSSVQKRDRVKSKQKIKIISEPPIKGRNSQKIIEEARGKEVRRTYDIITPSLESNSRKTESYIRGPIRMNSPPPIPPKKKQ